MTCELEHAFFETWRHERGRRANAKRRVFASLCREHGGAAEIPTSTLLRQLERGQLDETLGEWKPLFAEVLRQWMGFRLEHEALASAPVLCLAWWVQPVTWLRRRGHFGGAARMVSALGCASVVLVLLALVSVTAWHRAQLQLDRLTESEQALKAAAQAAEEAEAEAARVLLDTRDDSLRDHLAGADGRTASYVALQRRIDEARGALAE
ncbi:MAG: hypothetical protein AAF533_02665 [Acidobacteriota bacterium]